MSSLKLENDELVVKLGGLESAEFRQALATVKSLPGANYDSRTKSWTFPPTPDTAARLVHGIRCSPSADVLSLVRGRAESIAAELAARTPEDADIVSEWGNIMFPYQRAGAAWMSKYRHVINADDMGLGKTIQAITAVDITPEALPALVICPNTVKGVWAAELAKWTESTRGLVVSATGQERVAEATANTHAYTILNWELLQDRIGLAPELRKVKWGTIIADEAHRMKNRKSQQAKALHKLRAPNQYALTGTPILNSPDELWSILHWLDPETWGSYWRFVDMYCETTAGYAGSRVITGVKNADKLRFALRHVLMRRTKSQVADDLPEKLPTQTIDAPLTAAQRKLYADAENSMWIEVERELEKGPGPTADAIESAVREGRVDRLRILVPNAGAQIARMRQITGSAALLGGKDHSSKLDALVELVKDHADKQFVVFTHHRELAELAADRLCRAFKDPAHAAFFHGDTDPTIRGQLVDQFQAHDLMVLCCTIMAGGQGITLTAADTAIFLELEWTPEYNRQAEDRIHRWGQKNRVSIIRILAPDTIDTGRIVPTNLRKQMIASSILGGSA